MLLGFDDFIADALQGTGFYQKVTWEIKRADGISLLKRFLRKQRKNSKCIISVILLTADGKWPLEFYFQQQIMFSFITLQIYIAWIICV